MVLDIHSFCEVEHDGQWTMLGDVFPDLDYDPAVPFFGPTVIENPWSQRFRFLFNVLAGVRSPGDIPLMDKPRGVPADASQGYRDEVKDADVAGHSHSYFTLHELLNSTVYDQRVGEGTVREHLGNAWFDRLEFMKQFAPDGDFHRIRMVFFFDS